MFQKKLIIFLMTVLMLLALAACSGTTTTMDVTSDSASAATSGNSELADVLDVSEETAASATSVPAATAPVATAPASAAEALAATAATVAPTVVVDAAAAASDSSAVAIALNGDSISTDSAAVSVNGSVATITAAGTYTLSGTLSDGQIVVDTEDEAVVTLVLNGVDISNSTTAPIAILNAEDAVIVLADNSANNITDASSYVFPNAEEDEPNAAIFSNADLTCLLYTSPSPRDGLLSRMPSSA